MTDFLTFFVISACFLMVSASFRIRRLREMQLRDYFAAAALQGYMANKDRPTYFHPETDAQYVFAMADAMLKEREK